MCLGLAGLNKHVLLTYQHTFYLQEGCTDIAFPKLI